MRKVGVVRGPEAVAEWRRLAAMADAMELSREQAMSRGRTRSQRYSALLGRRVVIPTAFVATIALSVLPPGALDTPLHQVDAAVGVEASAALGAAGDLSSTSEDPAIAPLPITRAQQEAAPVNISLAGAAADAALETHVTVGAAGIPVSVLAAYRRAEANIASSNPSCHLPWWVLAGIGRIESGHASGGRVDASGTTRGRILGPRLDGSLAGTAVIRDSDGGALDGDASYDRAVGPMQFLPGTWRRWGRDGNGDGVVNPHNVYDAATAAGAYLCASGGDLSIGANLAKAILSYNYSSSYLESVLTWGMAYRDGVSPSNDSSGTVPPGGSSNEPGTPAPIGDGPSTTTSSSTSSTTSSSTSSRQPASTTPTLPGTTSATSTLPGTTTSAPPPPPPTSEPPTSSTTAPSTTSTTVPPTTTSSTTATSTSSTTAPSTTSTTVAPTCGTETTTTTTTTTAPSTTTTTSGPTCQTEPVEPAAAAASASQAPAAEATASPLDLIDLLDGYAGDEQAAAFS